MPIGIAKNPEEKSRKISKALKGRKLSEEHKRKISNANQGHPSYTLGKHWNVKNRKGSSRGMLGKKQSNEFRQRNRKRWLGEKNPNWKGGIMPLTEQIRKCFKYRQWRSDIFTKDDFTCQKCRKKSGILNAHHLKDFSLILLENKIKTLEEALNCEELWNINNGVTFCKKCHNKTKGKAQYLIY